MQPRLRNRSGMTPVTGEAPWAIFYAHCELLRDWKFSKQWLRGCTLPRGRAILFSLNTRVIDTSNRRVLPGVLVLYVQLLPFQRLQSPRQTRQPTHSSTITAACTRRMSNAKFWESTIAMHHFEWVGQSVTSRSSCTVCDRLENVRRDFWFVDGDIFPARGWLFLAWLSI